MGFFTQETGVGRHSLLQGIFLTQGSNLSPALQADSLLSEPPGKPKFKVKDNNSKDYIFTTLKVDNQNILKLV